MTVGDTARAGDPETVLEVGAALRGRTAGADVLRSLDSAVMAVGGGQSGSALSVERIKSLIQASSAPANLVHMADQTWSAEVSAFGGKMMDIERRASAARNDFDAAGRDAVSAKQKLTDFDALNVDIECASNRPTLVYASNDAKEYLAEVTQRLKMLDDERLGADSSAASSISEQGQLYVSARRAMPKPPTVSAGVRVGARMPDGTGTISAVELAQLQDPDLIADAWQALTPEDRQLLIADSPLLIGNLDGIALRDRNTANVITAKEYRDELGKQIKMFNLLEKQYDADGLYGSKISDLRGEIKSLDAILGVRHEGDPEWFGKYLVFDENGRSSVQNGAVLVGFNPLRDSIVTFQGALDPTTGNIPSWMEQVGVVVPGTNSNLASFTGDLDRGKDLFSQSGTKSGYFTWHGAPMPEFELPGHISEAAERGFADTAAPRLASFVNSLELPKDTDLVPIAHSYGAVVLGTAESLGLKADRIVYVAPAGLGHEVTGLADFPNTKDKPHFVLQARNDLVVGWNQGNGAGDLGHGSVNPLDTPGVTRLETGYLDARDPGAGTIESPGWIDTHSTPFRRGSTSLTNITDAVTGDSVSLYHPNDRELVQSGFQPVWVEFPDSGAGKPVEEISSLDLTKVK